MDWTAMAAPWLQVEAETDAAHAQIRHALMAKADLQQGQSVLDIGPGAGISLINAARAVGPSGHVTGIEIAPPFAERARARVPQNVTVTTGDAATHPFPPSHFDAALSMLGIMFFEDPIAAFTHLRRSLKPGAPLTFACWGPRDHNPWFQMTSHLAEEILGPGPAFDPDAPGPMALADTAKIDRILSASGWSATIETRDLLLTPLGDPEDVAALHMKIGGAASRMRIAKDEGTLTDVHRAAIRSALTQGFEAFAREGSVQVPARIHLVQATA